MKLDFKKEQLRKPKWIRTEIPSGENYQTLNSIKEKYSINTVCEEAKCPNLGFCWKNKHITIMILGDKCTRNCRFCGIEKHKGSLKIDLLEPKRVALALSEISPKYVVLTSVTRDDLDDGGAFIFSETIKAIKEKLKETIIEVLIPDFNGDSLSLEKIIKESPSVIGHNIETTRALHKIVRPMSNYDTSINLLSKIKKISSNIITKSSFMVGLGETKEDVYEMLANLKKADVDIVYIGQYLSPGKNFYNVKKYLTIEEFQEFKKEGEKIGIKVIESAPLVRSSYNAKKSYDYLTETSIN